LDVQVDDNQKDIALDVAQCAQDDSSSAEIDDDVALDVTQCVQDGDSSSAEDMQLDHNVAAPDGAQCLQDADQSAEVPLTNPQAMWS
jgi:hypothetical protein